MECDHSVPLYFTKWSIPQEGVRAQLWKSNQGVVHYSVGSNQWAGILSTPKWDQFTGEPIGPIIVEQHAKELIALDGDVDQFLKELPPIPTEQLQALIWAMNDK
jgi:hypothetical protein